MLKGISKILTGDMLKMLSDMGHGDELVIADANFPAASVGQRVILCPGISERELLQAIVKVFPLDTAEDFPAVVMAVTPKDSAAGVKAEIWDDYAEILKDGYGEGVELYAVARQEFYDRAKKAYLVIQTGEERLYGDLLLVKGVINS